MSHDYGSKTMEMSEFIEIALAGASADRVEVKMLQPAEVGAAWISPLSQVIAELVENATAFSDPTQVVQLTGGFVDGAYVFSIVDEGVGISETLLDALNKVLASPSSVRSGEVPMGLTVVARLAVKNGFRVELVPNSPGTRATVTVPSKVVTPSSSVAETSLPRPLPSGSPSQQVFAPSPELAIDVDEEKKVDDVEEFLESIFAPLRLGGSTGWTPESGSTRTSARAEGDYEPNRVVASLQVRVPGENFFLVEDEASVLSSEAAIDLKSALTRFQDGRRDAGRQDSPD